MEQLIKDILTPINSFVWGPVMLVMLVGTGLYLNIGLKFYSFRNWIRAYKCLWEGRSDKSSHGEISPWNALMTAIAADIGTGNIVGGYSYSYWRPRGTLLDVGYCPCWNDDQIF